MEDRGARFLPPDAPVCLGLPRQRLLGLFDSRVIVPEVQLCLDNLGQEPGKSRNSDLDNVIGGQK